MTRLGLVLCSVLALGGCASTFSGAANAPPPSAMHAGAASAITPQNEASLYLNVVEGLIKEERYGAAVAFLDDYAVKRRDLVARYWLLRGDASLGLGRQEDAVAAYAKLDGTPLAAEGWNGKGRVAAAHLQWRYAAENFQQAVRSEPANPDFLNNLAFASMHLGRCDASAAYLRQAYELKPGSELIRNNLIIALTLAGDSNGADAILGSVTDAAQREQVKAIVASAIKNNNLSKDGKS
jgi:Flp pilus assembly protein TadD